MALHEVQLKGYSVRPGNLSLGTFDSYGIEQLHVTLDDMWSGLAVTATFNPPKGEPVEIRVPENGLIDVPAEATANEGTGAIVYCGVANGVQLITKTQGYNVITHGNVGGTAPFNPSESLATQVLQAALNAEKNSAEAKDVADGLRNDAANGKFDGKDGAKGDKGETGTTPKLKIGEDNLWHVSYDNGATWVSLGVKATGEAGKDGEDGLTPHIGENGNWWVGNTDTGVSAKGDKGDTGARGADGVSPTASVTQTDDGAEFTVTDASGTTTATIRNGTDGRDGAPGAPGKDAVVDATLTQDGQAADAKVTGEKIGELKEDIENTNSILEENLVRISANLINPDNMLENTAITISNRISTSSNTTYKSYLNIPVKAGESYYIGNSHRVSCVIDSAENKLVLQSNTQNKTGPFIFNVEKSGLLCVCFYMTEEKPWVALAEKETEYEEYGSKLLQEWLKLQIKKYGYSNPLKGKTIYNFGDSISNGQGNLVGDKRLGPAELVALDNDMVCTDFAVSGSTMSTAGGGNYTLKRINDAISASPITPDFVLLAGGINDLKVTSVGDFSEPSSNDDFGEEYIGLLDTPNFSGAFETAIYRILNAWPGTQLIYMTEHKMPSHYNDGTETLYQTAEKICKKWCVPILDMWNSGGLNMSVLANNKAYGTGDVNLDGIHTDTTHPNGEAYRLYYVPKLKSKLLECCPKTN